MAFLVREERRAVRFLTATAHNKVVAPKSRASYDGPGPSYTLLLFVLLLAFASLPVSKSVVSSPVQFDALDRYKTVGVQGSGPITIQAEVLNITSTFEGSLIYSYVTLLVTEVVTGPDGLRGSHIVLRVVGGEVNGTMLWRSDQPYFFVGEKIEISVQQEGTVYLPASPKKTLTKPSMLATTAGYVLEWYNPLVGWMASPTSPGPDWYGPLKWSSATFDYWINPQGIPSDLSSSSFISYATASFQTWQDDPNSAIAFTYRGTRTDLSAGLPSDGVNVVGWGYLGGSTIAVTWMWGQYTPGSSDSFRFTETDMIFDNSKSWSAQVTGVAGRYDVQNIGTHEAGHTFGLGDLYDPTDSEETMYGYGSLAETKKRTLEWGDRAGVAALYPPPLNVALVAPANGATVITSPVTFQVRVTDLEGAPVQGADVVVYVNHPSLSIIYFCTSSAKSDSNGYFSCDITLTDSGTNYRWYADASKSGYGSVTSQTGTFNYFVQVTMSISYSIAGGGTGYSAPVFNYVQGGQGKTYALTTTVTDISLDSGSVWSVTSNPLSGSSSSERWYSGQTLSGTASAASIIFSFYHQYSLTLSYAVSGGGSGYSAPTFAASRYGVSAPQTLTSTATGYWYDAGSSWSATPNPLSGSGTSERWITMQTTSGTISSTQTIVFAYQHQYYLTTQVSPPGGGSVSVLSGWQNAGIAVPITATPSTDYAFYYWGLDGTNIGNNPSYSVPMNLAHSLTAIFRGSSSTSFGLSAASIPLGGSVTLSGSITPTQPSPGIPAGTTVVLSYRVDGATWNTFITTVTDSSEAYSVVWYPPYPTGYQIRASWSGNADYAGATSSVSALSVTGTAPPQVMLLVTGPPSTVGGSSSTFDVVVNNHGASLTATLYVEVTGPGGYEYFDTLRVSVAAGSTERHQFTWQAPSTTGSYQVLVGLIPPRPTSMGQTQITIT